MPAPQDLVDGTDPLGLVEQPVLQAGDLLLCTDSLMRGVRPWQGRGAATPARMRVHQHGRAAGGQRPRIHGEDTALPEWADDLTDIQRAVLHNPNRPYPPPVVHSDGEKVWMAEEPGVFHPSIYIRDPDSDIDEKEFFHWDLCGHLVLARRDGRGMAGRSQRSHRQ